MKQIQFTPDNIQELKSNEVFVFGSNLLGNHAGGAARIAVDKFGAINGQATGLQGQSYAIPTLDANMNKVEIDPLIGSLNGLNDFAAKNEDKIFYVTKIGCGIAGFDEIEIARLFQSIKWSKNVILPRLFADAKLTDFAIKLKNNEYSYRIENEKIIIDEKNGYVYLRSLTTLPEGTQFNNGGYVDLRSLTTLPEGTQFNNGGYVDLSSLTTLPEGTQFNNGGDVDLSSLTTLPEGTQFNNGGYVDLSSGKKSIKTPYLKRFDIKVKRNKIILFKRVSFDYKTQEGQKWETVWKVGTKLTHPNWKPLSGECGEGKFHACAKPSWCDTFRRTKGDRYIAIEVHIKDLHEWTESPSYPSKIAFRECRVLYECDREGNKIL